MKSSFFIVADKGNVKAYRAEDTPANRPPRMHLVQAFTLTDAHLKPTDVYTDEAGAFPTQTGAGMRQNFQGNSMAEKHVDIENGRRLVKQLAGHISSILRQEEVEWWSFAAPSEIHEAVLTQLEPVFRDRVAEHVPLDLVNTPPHQLLEHFSAVKAA
jgi:hypothetical protein